MTDPVDLPPLTEEDYAAIGRAFVNLALMPGLMGWSSPASSLAYLPDIEVTHERATHVAVPLSQDFIHWCTQRPGHKEAGDRVARFLEAAVPDWLQDAFADPDDPEPDQPDR